MPLVKSVESGLIFRDIGVCFIRKAVPWRGWLCGVGCKDCVWKIPDESDAETGDANNSYKPNQSVIFGGCTQKRLRVVRLLDRDSRGGGREPGKMLKIEQRDFIRFLSLASLSVGAMALTPGAYAAPVPIAGISTLQDLINTGHSGITIGDKQYYDFAYSGSPMATGTPPPVNPAPTAAQIAVLQPDAAVQGFRFLYPWSSSTTTNNQDSLISYSVHVINTSPQDFIGSVGLDFSATAVGGALDNSTVSEKVLTLDQTGTYGTLNVKEFGPGNVNNVDSMTFSLPGGIRDLRLIKDIQLHSSSSPTFQPGASSIAYVDNTFVSVPEPVSAGALSVGAGMLLVRRRKSL